jgi:DNA-binding response OmpR family regulator
VTSSDLALPRARILLIENEPDAALFVIHVLGTRGQFHVTHIADPAVALRLAATEDWDLVLTDVELPGMTGLELLQALRRLAPGLPVAVLTAHIPAEATAAALRGLADAFLEKPIPVDDLVATVTALVTMRNSSLRRLLYQRAVRVARVAYVSIERSPLAPLLRIPAVQRVKSRITYMPAAQVLTVLDQVDAAGVQAWVAGGWGVDALAGRQTRRHYDLDLLMGDEPGEYAKVAAVLSREGFREAETEHNPGLPMPWRHAWRHDEGYSVEVLPVVLRDPPFSWPATAAAEAGQELPFTVGTIGGWPVPCLSAALQLTLHTGYPPRPVDETDTGVLRACQDRLNGRS